MLSFDGGGYRLSLTMVKVDPVRESSNCGLASCCLGSLLTICVHRGDDGRETGVCCVGIVCLIVVSDADVYYGY